MKFGEAKYDEESKLTILIDGDIDLYRIADICMEEIQIDRMFTYVSNQDKMEHLLDKRWSEYKEKLGATDIVIALSDYNSDLNFRKVIMPSYKEDRRDQRKPLGYKQLREYVEANYVTYCKPTLEADDVLGILATNDEIIEGDKIVISADKDLKTIPCKLWNPDKEDLGVLTISEPMADFNFLVQTLAGDITDNYKGCPKMGEKTAPKLLETVMSDTEDERTLWDAVVDAYIKEGLNEHDALANARCARILRNEDYDWDKEEVKLWMQESGLEMDQH